MDNPEDLQHTQEAEGYWETRRLCVVGDPGGCRLLGIQEAVSCQGTRKLLVDGDPESFGSMGTQKVWVDCHLSNANTNGKHLLK